MATYKIMDSVLDALYCVVTNDDGSTFGQWVSGESGKTRAGIDSAIDVAIAKIAIPQVQADAEVAAAIINKSVLTIPQKKA